MAPRPHILAETIWKTVQEANYEVVVLPWSATGDGAARQFRIAALRQG